jgi:septum formation protein
LKSIPKAKEAGARARALVLASTSPHRRVLLERLGLAFTCVAPGVDEAKRPGEPPAALARRLAVAKAGAGARLRPDALVVGSDQLAACDGTIFGKPITHDAAVAQLTAVAGREVTFYTAVCLRDAVSGDAQVHVDETIVQMRVLDAAEIERYLRREGPYDCAGSFKSEGLGIALFDAVRSDDPTALQGLPLIWLCGALARAGLPVL